MASKINLNSEEVGSDCQGSVYKNIQEMWDTELSNKDTGSVINKIGSKDNWYSKQAQYWEKTEATVEGVLGGFGKLHKPDITDSRKLLELLHDKYDLNYGRVIDCGAGMGRITKEFLLHFFKNADVVDQNPKYIEACKQNFKDDKRVVHFIAKGLQELEFPEKYDCIWIQWVCNYLTDEDFVKFLKRCSEALVQNGFIIVKENIAQKGFIVDKEDSSVTRSDKLFLDVFKQADLKVVETQMQSNFPKELFKVKTYALVPAQKKQDEKMMEETEEKTA
ncbi:AdoMet-dependent proline di-methyltransferase (macronuclear) [Tetrahymena thermophila SB210]|uniref:Alpha N-terminal protein methyltransferase 1 n=1 Tax=Tetrahymena thermophila (strain SB210) TaxID=312017 RepID=I7MK94_TETTS|nr:AdoMet-dependent proline di-methyltransferase [Tetrahymena thermophila SB210]EAR97899.2 AdoMet-dependent proline di-methyltransferase [Tetrahymena thermophila SB210]|eukprot:XP_001018144.2 AdoMet-dependent proline di-methyltransferase [Tetrahymena thermophila SB210]